MLVSGNEHRGLTEVRAPGLPRPVAADAARRITPRRELVAKAIRLLGDHVNEPVSMAELSRLTGVSERTLRAAFSLLGPGGELMLAGFADRLPLGTLERWLGELDVDDLILDEDRRYPERPFHLVLAVRAGDERAPRSLGGGGFAAHREPSSRTAISKASRMPDR